MNQLSEYQFKEFSFDATPENLQFFPGYTNQNLWDSHSPLFTKEVMLQFISVFNDKYYDETLPKRQKIEYDAEKDVVIYSCIEEIEQEEIEEDESNSPIVKRFEFKPIIKLKCYEEVKLYPVGCNKEWSMIIMRNDEVLKIQETFSKLVNLSLAYLNKCKTNTLCGVTLEGYKKWTEGKDYYENIGLLKKDASSDELLNDLINIAYEFNNEWSYKLNSEFMDIFSENYPYSMSFEEVPYILESITENNA